MCEYIVSKNKHDAHCGRKKKQQQEFKEIKYTRFQYDIYIFFAIGK